MQTDQTPWKWEKYNLGDIEGWTVNDSSGEGVTWFDERQDAINLVEAVNNWAEVHAEPDITKCPQCKEVTDNGFDREIPPNPYLCSECTGKEDTQ